MAATTTERLTTDRMGKDPSAPNRVVLPMAAGAKVLKGTMVMTNASGLALAGATATGQICWGRACDTYDNTNGAASALSCEVEQGVFLWANLGADPVVQADVGLTCFLADNQTVAHSNGGATRSVAGRVVQVTAAGVWVKTAIAGS